MLQTSVEMVKPGGTGSFVRHMGQPGAFSAERFFHRSITIGAVRPELKYVLFHILLLYEFVTISEKSANVRNCSSKPCNMARRLFLTAGSGAFTSTLSK